MFSVPCIKQTISAISGDVMMYLGLFDLYCDDVQEMNKKRIIVKIIYFNFSNIKNPFVIQLIDTKGQFMFSDKNPSSEDYQKSINGRFPGLQTISVIRAFPPITYFFCLKK